MFVSFTISYHVRVASRGGFTGLVGTFFSRLARKAVHTIRAPTPRRASLLTCSAAVPLNRLGAPLQWFCAQPRCLCHRLACHKTARCARTLPTSCSENAGLAAPGSLHLSGPSTARVVACTFESSCLRSLSSFRPQSNALPSIKFPWRLNHA